MATQVQNRRGTTAEHSTFTGANGELTVDTTKRTLVVHDGSTAGGRPLLREDQSNLPTSAPTTGIYNASGSLAISTNGTKRIEIQADGDIDIDNGGVFYDATNNRLAIGSNSPQYPLDVTGTGNGGIVTDGSIRAYSANRTAYLSVAYNGIDVSTNSGGMLFTVNQSEAARIDSSKRLLVGTSSARSPLTHTPRIQVEGLGYETSTVSVISNSNDTNGAYSFLGKSRGTSLGSNTIVQSNDEIGGLDFIAADGTQLIRAARITALVDGTPGANDMPGRLVFSTTSDGASSPTERMRVGSNGKLLVAGTNDNGAYNIQCNGTGVWGFGAYVNGSDERLKENINPLPASLDVVKALNPVVFQYKPEFTADTSVQPGFIAQELQTALADQTYLEGVVQAGGQYLNVAYQALIPVLTKALQEAIIKIETLEAKVAALESA